ncbi:hypothetical protein [Sphaerochaeta sp.]|uniref:hypothetical protein n=1 Tax=Sphaerochaeta sp. TaxID=1972642 RepID=UPI00258B2148|nr:hypothetical protein [Sphaerochaeta sp.]MDD3456464.1 hypothetical protein [Sphaerochaeta sp.]
MVLWLDGSALMKDLPLDSERVSSVKYVHGTYQNDQENPMVGAIALASILFETHITDEGLLPDQGYPNQMIW